MSSSLLAPGLASYELHPELGTVLLAAAADHGPLIDAGFTAHPSLLDVGPPIAVSCVFFHLLKQLLLLLELLVPRIATGGGLVVR